MIDIAEQTVRQAIQDMDFIERYGGVSVPVLRKGTTKSSDQVYPVSAFVDVESCFEDGTYQNLCPDDSKKSVVYWEQRSAMDFVDTIGAKERIYHYRVPMRLVVYINLMKVGIKTKERSLPFLPNLIQAIVGNRLITSDYYKNTQVEFPPPDIVTDQSIFSRYSYEPAMVENMKLYPHSYYALDFDVDIHFDKHCHSYETLQTEIECQPY